MQENDVLPNALNGSQQAREKYQTVCNAILQKFNEWKVGDGAFVTIADVVEYHVQQGPHAQYADWHAIDAFLAWPYKKKAASQTYMREVIVSQCLPPWPDGLKQSAREYAASLCSVRQQDLVLSFEKNDTTEYIDLRKSIMDAVVKQLKLAQLAQKHPMKRMTDFLRNFVDKLTTEFAALAKEEKKQAEFELAALAAKQQSNQIFVDSDMQMRIMSNPFNSNSVHLQIQDDGAHAEQRGENVEMGPAYWSEQEVFVQEISFDRKSFEQ